MFRGDSRLKNRRLILWLCLICIFSLCFSGCNTSFLNLKQKVNMKNTDFEYIKQGKIRTVIVQSTRDKSYRFIITDQRTISELYDILSSAKPASSKSTLDPDYTFELHESSSKVYTYKYVCSVNDENAGNFFDDNKIYAVSSEIDDNIISSFSVLKRTPKNFKNVYYEGITEMLSKYTTEILSKDAKNKNKKIGIDISGDIEAQKFIISSELNDFSKKIASTYGNAEIKQGDKTDDVNATVRTQGYKSDRYKIIITFTDSTDNSETKYYLDANYKNYKWNFDIYTSNDSDKIKTF